MWIDVWVEVIVIDQFFQLVQKLFRNQWFDFQFHLMLFMFVRNGWKSSSPFHCTFSSTISTCYIILTKAIFGSNPSLIFSDHMSTTQGVSVVPCWFMSFSRGLKICFLISRFFDNFFFCSSPINVDTWRVIKNNKIIFWLTNLFLY